MATSNSSRQHAQREKMLKKRRQLSGYESSSPEDEEEDETFVTLQKLLKALNNSNSTRPPTHTALPTAVGDSYGSTSRRMGVVNSSTANSPIDQQPRLSQEEMLEERRQERERFRHMLFASKSVRRRRPAYYVQSEDDEEEEEPVPSVESAISNRVISGSFSRLNVHVINRSRWAREEVERLPIVLLPKDGKIVSPADNPKLNVCHTNEFEDLHDSLMDQLKKMPAMVDPSRLLTPPQSTWYMQMRNMDAIQC